MTIVCALAVGDETILGCDQKVGTLRVPSKWVIHGQWAIGVSGAHRTQQLIQRATIPETDDAFVVATWIRDTLVADGYSTDKNDYGLPTLASGILIALPGRVWSIAGCFSSVEVPGFTAVGSGCEYAEGAAWRVEGHAADRTSAISITRHAIEAAIALDPNGCGGEAVIYTHGWGK